MYSEGLVFEDPVFPADETSLFADPAAAGKNASAEQTFRKDQDAFLAGTRFTCFPGTNVQILTRRACLY
jgi:hypothetical protein